MRFHIWVRISHLGGGGKEGTRIELSSAHHCRPSTNVNKRHRPKSAPPPFRDYEIEAKMTKS